MMNVKAKAAQPGQPGKRHMADNLTDQLNSIMVQMGRIMTAPRTHPDRADLIAINARKKMNEATDNFHQALSEMEIEITRAKAAFIRDLQHLREKKQASEQAQPPAPMVIDLEGLKPTGPAVPVAPMMATSGSPYVANRGIPKADGKPVAPVAPVAPFPDMGGGMGAPKPAASIAFARTKPPVPPVDQTRPSPKQPTPKQTPKPAPKPNPPSGRPANKPNPLANAQKQAPKPPSSAPSSAPPATPAAPPSTPVAAPAPMAAAPPAPVVPVMNPQPPATTASAMQNPFTNATFTLDSTNSDTIGQPGNSSIDLDSMLDSFGAGGPEDPANMDQNNDTTMSDLDHFFDMDGGGSSNFDDANFSNTNNYMDMTDDFESFSAFK